MLKEREILTWGRNCYETFMLIYLSYHMFVLILFWYNNFYAPFLSGKTSPNREREMMTMFVHMKEKLCYINAIDMLCLSPDLYNSEKNVTRTIRNIIRSQHPTIIERKKFQRRNHLG